MLALEFQKWINFASKVNVQSFQLIQQYYMNMLQF